MKGKLTYRRKMFCECFPLALGNAAKAARMAGYSKKTARIIACQLLKVPAVVDYIRRIGRGEWMDMDEFFNLYRGG